MIDNLQENQVLWYGIESDECMSICITIQCERKDK